MGLMTRERKLRFAYLLAGFALALGVEVIAQSSAPGPSYVSSGGTRLRMLLDSTSMGGSEVELGEMTLPAKLDSGEHTHGSVEIFYVISGELEHVVNGKSHLLKPGMVGYVRPPDKVIHRVPGDVPVKTLVIWAPGGEGARITGRWRREP